MLNKMNSQILVGIILGIVVGYFANDVSTVEGGRHFWGLFVSMVEPIGIIFIRLLKMIILPLVFASVVMGVVGLGDMKHLGKLGGWTGLYFVGTTTIASLLALFGARWFLPSEQIVLTGFGELPENISRDSSSLLTLITEIVPDNIVHVMSEGLVLPVIFFSIFLGTALMSIGKRGQALVDIIDSLNDAILKCVDWIMKLTPIGVFALIATVISQTGIGALQSLIHYMAVVCGGLLVHMFVVLPILIFIVGKYSPIVFFKHMSSAISVAFSTSSSMATLPITLSCLKKNVKISDRINTFVCPLGATINMDGTAIFQAVATVFIAKIYGIDLSVSQMMIVVVTTVLASVGAAGVPSAGLVTIVIILNAIGLPLDALGLILAVDRLLDMLRTAVNIFSDSVGALIVARLDGEKLQS